MKALVTGANGLIGANLCRELLRAGHEVVGFVRPTGDHRHLAELPIELAYGDVLDHAPLEAAMGGCDWVFHTAVHFSYWGHPPGELTHTALEGTRNVLAAAQRLHVNRVVITSSSVTLGAGYSAHIRDERHSVELQNEESDYVLAKVEQEREAIVLARQFDVDLVIACPTMTVGPFGASLGPSNSVITSYLADPFRLTWRGGCNIVSVRDVAIGHLLLAERGVSGQRYILGSENLSWIDIHQLIARLAGVAPPGPPVGATSCYCVALAEEARAKLTGRPPLATRAQAKMVGRYYWYTHALAATLGYEPGSARQAFAEALAWLAPSRFVSRETRAKMRLDREVHVARAAIANRESEFVRMRA